MTQAKETGTRTMADEANALHSEIDRLSLNQALVDFEIANDRAVDLTQRLIAANDEVIRLHEELDELRAEHGRLAEEHHAMRSSVAYRIATKLWDLRNLLRP